MQIEQDDVQLFFTSVKSPFTKENYLRHYRMMKIEPNVFVRSCFESPTKVDRFLLSWFAENRTRYSGASLRVMLASVKSLCDFCGVQGINWKRLTHTLPPRSVSHDREILPEEIRKIYQVADERLRFLISLLLSTGIREGAIKYLRVEHLIAKDGAGILTVYAGEPEQYTTFATPECLQDWQVYKELRERKGEIIRPNSPLLANIKRRHDPIIPLSPTTVKLLLLKAWQRAGFEQRQFKIVHGFRKTYKTRLENNDMKSIFIEANLGHRQGIHDNYYRPATMQARMDEYRKHMRVLYVSKEPELEEQIKESEERRNQDNQANRLELLEVKEEQRRIREVLNKPGLRELIKKSLEDSSA